MSYSTTQRGPRLVREGLILHLDAANTKSYPGSGDTWYDLTKYNQNISLNPPGSGLTSPTFSTFGGGSFLFNGTDQVLTSSLSPNISGSAYSVSAWVYSTSNNVQNIYEVGAIFGGQERSKFDLFLFYTGNPTWTFSDADKILPLSSIPVPINNWYNFVGTLDSSFNAKAYINGVNVGSATWNGYHKGTNLLQLGATYNPFIIVGPLFQYYFNGYISHFMIYNRSINADEVAQNFAALGPRFGYY